MICQKCQKNIANIQIVQTINGRNLEIYLCEYCASSNEKIFFKMPLGIDKSFQISLNDLLPGLINHGYIGNGSASNGTASNGSTKELYCDLCGLKFEYFQKTGKLGCSKCYEIFINELSPIISRIHGNAQHRGRIPGQKNEGIEDIGKIGVLKRELREAIAVENYEKAAELRDLIKTLQENEKASDKEEIS